MPINFPDAPSSGDTHTVGDKTWTYDGTAWNVVQNNIADHGNLGGLGDDDHTQYALADGTRGTFEASGAVSTHEAASDPHTQYLLADGSRTATELTVTNTLTVDTNTLHVDSTNNRVGIGTTTPTTALDISQVNPTLTINDTDGVAGGSIVSMIQFEANNAVAGEIGFATGAGNMISWASNGNYYAGTRSADSVFIRTNDTERLTINSSGNVGIGTTSPSRKLIVSGSGFDGGSADFISTNSGNGLLVTGVDGAGINDSAYLVLRDQNTSTFIGLTGTAAGAGDMRFSVNGERMRISSSGNVGIGTTTPSVKLHVKGAAANDTTAEMIIQGNGSMSFHGSLGQGSFNGIVNAGDMGIIFTDGTQGTGEFVIAPWASGTGGMRINSSGNVGIGQSSPSYRLDVSGPEDTASRVNISSGNTAYRYHMRFTRNSGLLANGIFSDTGAAYFGTPSDVNLKTGISDLSKQDALAAVSSLRPVEYRYLLDTEDVVRKGFIAQEMVEVIPEAVHRVGGGHPATSLIYDENGDLVATDVDENGDPIVQQEPDWMMTWEPITTTLVAAVQAQQELIQELTARIEALESAP